MPAYCRLTRLILLTGTTWFLMTILPGCASRQAVQAIGVATSSATPVEISTPRDSSAQPIAESELAAFPGAEGFGSQTKAGRGGKVLEVTNLGDSGVGSLRAAVDAEGPRVVVFRVAGTIELQSNLTIRNPYITIAGQTAPGDGITLRGMSADVTALVQIQTHDVVVRYLTIRAGPPSAGDGTMILATADHDTYNAVVDHTSTSRAVDRDLATWYDAHDITIQWSLFSEGLNCSINPKGCHSKGVLIGVYASDENKDQPGAYNISFHHNLMVHDGERNPYIEASGVIDVVNNVAYNAFGTFSHVDMVDQLAPDLVNYIGNYYKPGPNTVVKYGIRAINPGKPGAAIFVQGNLGPQRESDSLPDINIVNPDSRQFVVSTPFAAAPITSTNATQAYDQVLEGAGANEGLNCDGSFFLRRDAIDGRIVDDVRNGTGKIIDDPSQVGGWLTIAPASPCVDSDHDGMPDAWELQYGFNPNDPSDGPKDANGDGYTNLEEFLNGTKPIP